MEYEELLELEKTKKLTAKQERFCQEYVLCLNQTKAYMTAYPDSSYEAARRNASKLMTNTDIKTRVKELQEDLKSKFDISAGQLLYPGDTDPADTARTAVPLLSVPLR